MRPFRTCRDPFDTKKFSNLSPEILVEWIAPPVTWHNNTKPVEVLHPKRESEEKSGHLQVLQILHILCFTDVNSETKSQVFEQYVGIYEPKAPSFRVFDPRGVTRINFT